MRDPGNEVEDNFVKLGILISCLHGTRDAKADSFKKKYLVRKQGYKVRLFSLKWPATMEVIETKGHIELLLLPNDVT